MQRNITGRKILSIVLAISMILSMIPMQSFAAETVKISSEAELMAFAKRVNSGENTIDAQLTDDITVTGAFTPIGEKAKPYSGVFDGNGHKVTFNGDIVFTSTSERYGMFNTVKGKIQNLTVSGIINLGTKAGNVGGVAGYLDANGEIFNCTNEADISGKNNIGGIVGMGSKAAINQCGNTGTIEAVGSGAAGGIVGMAGSGTSVDNSYNRGNITAETFAAGGISGNTMGKSITKCYNTGNIKAGTKNAGGITGQASSYSSGINISDVYNTGTVTTSTANGKIIGMGKNNNTLSNCFYFGGNGIGNNAGTIQSAVADQETLKNEVLKLTDIYAEDTGNINGGMPILKWQISGGTPSEKVLSGDLTISGKTYIGSELKASYTGSETVNYQWYQGTEPIPEATKAAYTVSDMDIGSEIKVVISAEGYSSKEASAGTVPNYVAIDVTPADATVTITDADGNTWSGEGLYALPAGNYNYVISMGKDSEYIDKKGSFQVPYTKDDGLITIKLDIKKYDVTFKIAPEKAKLTLKDSKGMLVEPSVSGTNVYSLAKGTYTYSADLFGYETIKDAEIKVNGSETKEITLKKLPLRKVTFNISKEAGGPVSETEIVIRDNKGIVREFKNGLPDGSYTYTLISEGYASQKGELEIAGKNVAVKSEMKLPAAWDGKTLTEPAKDATDAYIIGSASELYWFAEKAPMYSDVVLSSDIEINEDMSAEKTKLFKWNPVGKYINYDNNSPYIGTFDGKGHTISGLYIDHGKRSGFFGYLGKGGEIKNLTLEGIVNGSGDYTGAFAGESKGIITNCHNKAKVNGTKFVGGIVGDLGSNGSIAECSNRGDVNASDSRAGGLTGVNHSENNSQSVVSCFNAGNITALNFAGGIIGDQYAYGSTVKDVYNTGNVNSEKGYAGGIFGNFRTGILENAYNTGVIKGYSDAARGKIAGALEASGQKKTFSNVYYLNDPLYDAVANMNGCTIQNGKAVAKTVDELKHLSEKEIGINFIKDNNNTNQGYPVLKWQEGIKTEPTAPEGDPSEWDGVAKVKPELKDGVYQIGSAAELAWMIKEISIHPDVKMVLISDIDLNFKNWEPMGAVSEERAFRGEFDGQGFTIKNLYMYSKKPVAGLFKANAGIIKNVTIEGNIYGSDYVGGIAAYNYGTIDNCNNNTSIEGGNHVAGITAQNKGTVTLCSNSESINGVKYVAGITAFNNKDSKTEKCFNTGQIKSASDFVSGVVAANEGNVENSYNRGLIISKSASLRAYTGGIVGWNNGIASGMYNTGSVISAGSYVGGAVGISTTGTRAENIYGTGNVMGMYYEADNGYEEYYVGAVAGHVTDQVQNGYYIDTLSVKGGGIAKSETEFKSKGFPVQLGNAFMQDTLNINKGYPVFKWQNADNTPAGFEEINGTVEIKGQLKSGSTLTADYKGNANKPVFVWYTEDEDGEYVIALDSDHYEIPVDLVGKVIHVKVFAPESDGFIEGKAESTVEGMSGSVFLKGTPVVGKTLEATYSREDDSPEFQWYRGNTPIEGARNDTYIVKDEDKGFTIKVRVTGNKPGYVEKIMPGKVVTADVAGVWEDAKCSEPANVGGTYVITSEAELHWFASQINGGNTNLKAKLAENITLTEDKWYPIGKDKTPFIGEFDGNSKTISGLDISGKNKLQQGIFGNIGGKGVVKNLNANVKIDLTGKDSVAIGGISGYTEGRIENCKVEGNVTGTNQIGGITGLIGLHGKVMQCRNLATVDGIQQVGGIAGANSYGDTYYCVNNGNVGSKDCENVGGIVGDTQNYAVITGCYNIGNVTGNNYVGGISGKIYVASAPLGCYSAGPVTGNLNTAAVVGNLDGTEYIPTVHGSFYLNTLPKDKTATAASEKYMKSDSFADTLNSDAFSQCYTKDNGTNNGYPVLIWETGEEQKPGGGDIEIPEPDRIDVSFTLLGDTAHGEKPHEGGTVTWISKTELKGLPKTFTAYDLFRTVLEQNGYTYDANGNGYVKSVTTPDGLKLGEYTNGSKSGWMYTINGEYPDYMPLVTLKDGDDMVFFYTDDYTQTGWNPDQKPGEQAIIGAAENVDKLIEAIGEVTIEKEQQIKDAREAYESLITLSKDRVTKLDILKAAEAKLSELKKPIVPEFTDKSQEYNKAYAETAEHFEKTALEAGNEWIAIGLVRGETKIIDKVCDEYYQSVLKAVKDGKGNLSERKYTEYARTILGLTALGYDPQNVGGYNLVEKLGNLNKVKAQGINGPIWALIALDSRDYKLPAGAETTRDKLINEILQNQSEAGSWGIIEGTQDIDITAMAIQALAPYYKTDDKVSSAVNKALDWLSLNQSGNGRFRTENNNETSESTSQVIIALSSLGLDLQKDTRFIKNGNNPIDGLMGFYCGNGEFSHLKNKGANDMSTEQAMLALASYKRLNAGKSTLYDMSDVKFKDSPLDEMKPVVPEKNENGNNTITVDKPSVVVKPSEIRDIENNLIVKLDSNNITYDKKAMDAIKKQIPADAKNVKFVLEKVEKGFNNKQAETIKYSKALGIFNIKLVVTRADGTTFEIHDFNGGKATITVPFANPKNLKLEVNRVEKDGTLKLMNSTYKNGMLSWVTDGHSFYMVTEAGKAGAPKTGDTGNMILWSVLLLGATGALVTVRRKEEK